MKLPDSAVLKAVLKGDLLEVKRLLREGVYIDAKSSDRLTPLWHAIELRYVDIALELINSGADVSFTDKKGRTLLMESSLRELPKVMKALVAAGADISAKARIEPFNVLELASACASPDIVLVLIDLGANLQKSGAEAIKQAVRFGNVRNTNLLIGLDAHTLCNEEQLRELFIMTIVREDIDMLCVLLSSAVWASVSQRSREIVLNYATDDGDAMTIDLIQSHTDALN